MNRYAKYLAGGAILATTALASGTVGAATITADLATGAVVASFATLNVAQNLFVGTTAAPASTLTLGPVPFSVRAGTSAYTFGTSVTVNITGAQFLNTSTVDATLYQILANGSITNETADTSGITVFTDKIIITVTALTWTGLEISGAEIREAQALVTAGSEVSLSGTITQSGTGTQLENITSRDILNSVTVTGGVVTALTNSVANNGSAPPFVNFGAGPPIDLTAELASFVISNGAAGQDTTLAASLSVTDFLSTTELRVSHPALSDAALVRVSLETGATTISTKTPAQISSGVATFTITSADALAGADSFTVIAIFNGSTSITGGTGGTLAVDYVACDTSRTSAECGPLADIAATAIASVTQNGLATQINTALPSTSSFASFVRIANTGTVAGTVTISVRNDNTGAVLGTYTSPSIPSQGSLQVSMANVEAGAGITPSADVPYKLVISGTINGYVQHLAFNAATGALSDLSAFRNGSGQTQP